MSTVRKLAAQVPFARSSWRYAKRKRVDFQRASRDQWQATKNIWLGGNPIVMENRFEGVEDWAIGKPSRTKASDDLQMHIKGYASTTSVNVGETIDFHVKVTADSTFSIKIYRFGDYGGAGARLMSEKRGLKAVDQPEPTIDPITNLIVCDWKPTVGLKIPRSWRSGWYLATLTTPNGWRSYVPFVVTDRNRRADLCVVIPVTTYQAYNQWPWDQVRGNNFYYGFDDQGQRVHETRGRKISFDRPYARNGMPNRVDLDHYFIRFAESAGYDVTYATSIDLHNGTLDLKKYQGVIFCGHDEYWSREMREATQAAIDADVHVAFLSANNVYWHIRVEQEGRVLVCYKGDTDPGAGANNGTAQWRAELPSPAEPEQLLLGVQYNGIIPEPQPLVVHSADHWVWSGSGAQDGDEIPMIVSGEADGLFPELPGPESVKQTILSQSPYQLKDGTPLMQNTSVYETGSGTIVFAAASLNWCWGLGHKDAADDRIRRATANVLDRMLQPRR